MNDMSHVIVPKSDQINSDDLISGPITITIESVEIKGGQEQPVSIFFSGSPKAFRPCKSMSRVLVAAWGPDANKYVGRSLTLYRDPSVKWGGMDVGGIRISHMTDIDQSMTMALTATKGQRKPFIVKPLAIAAAGSATTDPADKWASAYVAKLPGFLTIEEVNEFASEKAAKLEELREKRPQLHSQVTAALTVRRSELNDTDPFADQPSPSTPPPADAAAVSPTDAEQDEAASIQPGRDDSEMGDGFDGTDDEPDYVQLATTLCRRINNSETVIDVAAVVASSKNWPDDARKPVVDAGEARKRVLKGEPVDG